MECIMDNFIGKWKGFLRTRVKIYRLNEMTLSFGLLYGIYHKGVQGYSLIFDSFKLEGCYLV